MFVSGSKFWKKLWIPVLLCLNLSCINKRTVNEEYNLAQIAFKSSRESEAKRHAPKSFAKAKRYLKWGKKAYKEKNYRKSSEYFLKSRQYSEKAENLSRLKNFQNGGAF